MARHGFERQVEAVNNRGMQVVARFESGELKEPPAWSPSGLYKAIKQFLGNAADGLEAHDALRLQKASTHWLRHSHGSHALQGRAGHKPVPVQVVQNNLGHASVDTTSLYLTTERDGKARGHARVLAGALSKEGLRLDAGRSRQHVRSTAYGGIGVGRRTFAGITLELDAALSACKSTRK